MVIEASQGITALAATEENLSNLHAFTYFQARAGFRHDLISMVTR